MDSEESEFLFIGYSFPYSQTKYKQEETLESDKKQQTHTKMVKEINHIFSILVIRREYNQRDVSQLIQNLDLSSVIDKSEKISLKEMLLILESQINYMLEGCQIRLYLTIGQMYVNYGVHPFLQNIKIDLADIVNQNQITLKIKKVQWSLLHLQMLKDINQHMINGPPRLIQKQQTVDHCHQKKSKRSIKNFQKIGYIVNKVLSLKAKQKNFTDFTFDHLLKNDRQMTKKSIEDYYCQIRLGFKYKFDFNENRGKDMKLLRDFVRRKSQADVTRIPRKKKSKILEEPSISESLVSSSVKDEIDKY